MSRPQQLIPEWRSVDARQLREEILPAYRPAVLRGLVKDWPAVAAALQSPEALGEHIRRFDAGRPVQAFVGPAAIKGRYFYRDDLSGFNFERHAEPIGRAVQRLLALPEAEPPYSVYVGSTPTADTLPGFAQAHPNPLLPEEVAPRIWLGNASTVAAHFDLSDNIACVVGGRRRFTLFPPEQAENLYIGPLDQTVAGQPASLVDPSAPDLARFPRYAEALAAGMTAELEPGDAIYIPPLWWHSVEATGRLNVLVNYWWDEAPAAASPFDAMVHGLWTIAAQPTARRMAWRALFDRYVFRPDGQDPAAHLPPERRGVLGPASPAQDQRLRGFLMRGLSRP